MTATFEEAGADFIQHYGVKGMKWGVRRDLKKLRTSKEREDYLNEKDKKWIEKVNTKPKIAQVSRRTQARFRREVLKPLNQQYSWKDQTFSPSKKRAYEARVKEGMQDILEQEIFRAHKYSPTRTKEVAFEPQRDGTYKAVIVQRSNAKLAKQGNSIVKSDARRDRAEARAAERARKATAKHADEPEDLDELYDDFFMILEVDENGMITDIRNPAGDDLAQAEEVESFLEHHGVKGMKWGVRRDRSTGRRVGSPIAGTSKAARNQSTRPPKPGVKRIELKKPSAFTDDELNRLIRRMELEKRYSTLKAERRIAEMSKGERFVKTKLGPRAANVGWKLAEGAATAAGKAAFEKAGIKTGGKKK